MWRVDAIALDIEEKRLYWLTTYPYHAIASTDYDGNDARITLQSCHFIVGLEPLLAVLDHRVFWTSADALVSVSKNGSEISPRVSERPKMLKSLYLFLDTFIPLIRGPGHASPTASKWLFHIMSAVSRFE